MANKKIHIENLKNVMIVGLLITAILLLSFFWQGISLEKFKSISDENNDTRYKPQVSEFMVPEYIKIGFGSDGCTIIDPDKILTNEEYHGGGSIYEVIVKMIKSYLEQSEIYVEKIERKQYNEVMAYSSMSCEFAFEVPFREYARENHIRINASISPIENVTTITFSPFSSENMFVSDRKTGEFYRIAVQNESFAKKMAENINHLVTGLAREASSSYYAIKDVTGADNDVLMPIYMRSHTENMAYNSEFSINDKNDIEDIENGFFSDGMDFVRKITENKGSLIYILGFKEKVLKLNETGAISYSEEFNKNNYRELNLYESIENAIEYVSKHGGWKDIAEAGGYAYLKSVTKLSYGDGKYSGYHLSFGVKINGVPLEYDKGEWISIELCGTQVIKYFRDIIVPKVMFTDKEWNAIAPLDMLTANYMGMYDTIYSIENLEKSKTDEVRLNKEVDKEKIFDYVMSKIDKIEFCMFRGNNLEDKQIIPRWIVKVKDITFVFDPKSGKLEEYTIAEEE